MVGPEQLGSRSSQEGCPPSPLPRAGGCGVTLGADPQRQWGCSLPLSPLRGVISHLPSRHGCAVPGGSLSRSMLFTHPR